ncbi:MAG TPA: glycosyltransferase family 4 protein [Rhizomicrobium sp.]|nr:glycosyltransferase family 4 protein [Rhizomicrobium sp.]
MTSPQKHLLHVFPTFAVGGSQMRFAQLARLHGSRYRHSVLALDQNYDMAKRLAGIDCLDLKFDKRRSLESLGLFHRTLKRVAPDVLLTYNWGAVEWALVNRLGLKRPHIHVEDGFGPEEAKKQLLRRVWMRRLALSGRGTTVILPSRNLERIALGQWKLAPKQVRFIPNGIDCARFDVPRTGGGATVIGTVATLRREKNLPRLIKSFARLRERRAPGSIELLIVGDGGERSALESLAGGLGVPVTFAGQSDRPEDWLARMDIFALPSDTEQMPLSLLEAMAAGLPVVASDVGDVAQMVSSANSAYVVPADDEAFLAGLARLLDDKAAQAEIGRENRKKARENFDERVMAARYADLIG